MDMTREALQYVVGLNKPEIISIDGKRYTDKELVRVLNELRAAPLKMVTLTSLVDYIKAKVDAMADKLLVHVINPTTVYLISCLDSDREREKLVNVSAELPSFEYGYYMGHEEFIIAMQSKFIKNNDRDLILKFAGTVETGTVAQYGDDGVTQKATIRSGVASKTDALVPNPVKLIPYRTFLEVQQPESAFIFRMRENSSGGVSCAIFEADGGAWRYEAMKNVAEYLRENLKELGERFTVIY